MKTEDCTSFSGCNHDTVPLLDGPDNRRKATLAGQGGKRVEQGLQACIPMLGAMGFSP